MDKTPTEKTAEFIEKTIRQEVAAKRDEYLAMMAYAPSGLIELIMAGAQIKIAPIVFTQSSQGSSRLGLRFENGDWPTGQLPEINLPTKTSEWDLLLIAIPRKKA